jgi:hypothetical protein
MVGLIVIGIVWFISFSLGTLALAVYETSVNDMNTYPIRLIVLTIPIINTLYFIYIVYKIIQKTKMSELKL